jgi:uncharacterized membrane protein (UPF0127 family)
VGGTRIVVEVAATTASRARGLSGRSRLEPDSGMLFVLPFEQQVCLWMRETSVPLSAAFLTEGGSILELVEMAPQTVTQHCSAEPARYVLEMPARWFTSKNVLPADSVTGLEEVPNASE